MQNGSPSNFVPDLPQVHHGTSYQMRFITSKCHLGFFLHILRRLRRRSMCFPLETETCNIIHKFFYLIWRFLGQGCWILLCTFAQEFWKLEQDLISFNTVTVTWLHPWQVAMSHQVAGSLCQHPLTKENWQTLPVYLHWILRTNKCPIENGGFSACHVCRRVARCSQHTKTKDLQLKAGW